MANSYVRLLIHCVWSTKHREMCIQAEWEGELWAYLGGIAHNHGIHPIQIGGVENHVHALVEPPKSMNLPTLIKTLKTPASRWINESQKVRGQFRWQDGYGAFSVSASLLPRVEQYIRDQRDHHETLSFEQEYRQLLKWHGIAFDEAYMLG